jgi:hypothetical protein
MSRHHHVGAAWSVVRETLVGEGLSREHRLTYEEQMKAGKYLLVVHGRAEERIWAHRFMEGTRVALWPVDAEALPGPRRDKAASLRQGEDIS